MNSPTPKWDRNGFDNHGHMSCFAGFPQGPISFQAQRDLPVLTGHERRGAEAEVFLGPLERAECRPRNFARRARALGAPYVGLSGAICSKTGHVLRWDKKENNQEISLVRNPHWGKLIQD